MRTRAPSRGSLTAGRVIGDASDGISPLQQHDGQRRVDQDAIQERARQIDVHEQLVLDPQPLRREVAVLIADAEHQGAWA